MRVAFILVLVIYQVCGDETWCRDSLDCEDDQCCVYHENTVNDMLGQIKLSLGHNKVKRSVFEEAVEWMEEEINLGYCQDLRSMGQKCEAEPSTANNGMYSTQCPCMSHLECKRATCKLP